MDWEYPGDETRGGDEKLDKENYVLLCEELRKYFDQAPEKFELSMAIPVSIYRYEAGFDFENLKYSVHFFNVMAYDLHGIWDDPPLVNAHSDIRLIDDAIDYLITNSSVPPSQIILGMPGYGRSYTLANETCVSLGCPFQEDSNETAIGGCLDTHGFVPYVEIYQWTEKGEGKGYDSITVDVSTHSAVMVKDGNQFISYDNLETFKSKVDYATEKCLGGTMIWAIDMLPLGTQSSGSGGNVDGSGTPSVLDGEAASQAFCGTSWDDAISTCSKPCPSGISDDCPQGETCFAGTPCGEGAGGKPVGETCKICPDSTKQGIRSWVEVDVEINGTSTLTTCGELDYGIFLSVSKNSESCDAAKLAHAKKCCYDYPQDQCWLCRKGTLYYTIRSELNVTMSDGTESTCDLVNKMLAPEENDSEMCVTSQDAFFDACCYNQCSLCEGKGLKWWVEFDEPANYTDRKEEEVEVESDAEGQGVIEEKVNSEETEKRKSCSSIDASLYSDFIEDGTDECTEIKTLFSSECCYDFPANPCGLCKNGDIIQTLVWAEEVEYEGQKVSCGVVDNMLNSEENSSPVCASAKEKHADDCCFDKCSLCGEKQLAWDFIIDYYNDTSKTCGEVEALFAANQIKSNSKECSSIKADFEDLCCFIMPSTPCELCSEYIRWDDIVEFDDEQATCKEVIAMLKREEEMGEKCLSAKEVCSAF